MYSLTLTCTLFFVSFVHGAAFNPMYLPDHPNSKSDVGSPSNKTHVSFWNSSRPERLRSKHARWLPSRTNSVEYSRLVVKRDPSPIGPRDTRPTPEPTGDPSPSTTIHINDEQDFALILPKNTQEQISDSEADGVSFCSPGAASSEACSQNFPEGFVTAAAVETSDDGAWIQITGCIDPSKLSMSSSDDGGQFDVRYPNGAQCTFGGYGASFIEQVEPSAKRFCLRCCAMENDQINCNSHMDRAGCPATIPGVYDFPQLGVSCL